MGDGIPPGTGIYPERPPAAVASTTRRRRRTRSQITILDIDLANALSVAPAPRSWKAAEERVLSEFGGSFQTPMSAETDSPSPHKGGFVDDLKYVWVGLKKNTSFFLFAIALYNHKTTTASRHECLARGRAHATKSMCGDG